MSKFLWPLVLFTGCSHCATELPAETASQPSDAITAQADTFPILTDLQGRDLNLTSDPSVKAIALVFILPDCPICNAYISELNRLHQTFMSRGIAIILVQADTSTTDDEARQHAREYQIEPPVVLDRSHAWVKKSGAATAPEAAVFSAAGELVYRGRIDNQYAGLGQRRGAVTSQDLRDALEAVLAGQPVKEPRTEAIGCPIPKDSSGE